MRIGGEKDFEAPPEAVFHALLDPDLVADALPVLGRVTPRDDDHWSAEIRIPIGPRASRLRFDFTVVERDAPAHARLNASGRSLGASMRLDTAFRLAEHGGGTRMSWEAEIRLGGLLGRLPDGVVEPVGRRFVDGMLGAAERRARREAG